jgi:hypothetical protein
VGLAADAAARGVATLAALFAADAAVGFVNEEAGLGAADPLASLGVGLMTPPAAA